MDGMVTSGLPLTDGIGLAWALGVAIRTSVLLTVTGLLTLALFRRSAALRHFLWALAIGGVLALPLIPVASPWSWYVLPEMSSASTAPPGLGVAPEAPPEQPDGVGIDVEVGPASPTVGTAAITPGVSEPSEALGRDAGGSGGTSVHEDRAFETTEADVGGAGRTARTDAGTIPASSQRSTVPSFPLSTIAVVIWATIALLLALHQLVGRLALRRITDAAEPVDEAEVRWELAWSVGIAGVSRPVRVLRSDRVRVPMTWGVRRPVVLLPAESRDWSHTRLRLVLHHELAHVRRMDALTDVLSRTACALHWFNPMVWWAAARLRAESEKASDDVVLEAGARASEYAGHLLDIVTDLTPRRAPAGALPLAQRSEFEGRLLAILDPSRERCGVHRVSALALGGAIVAAVIAIGSAAPAAAEAGEPDEVAAIDAAAVGDDAGEIDVLPPVGDDPVGIRSSSPASPGARSARPAGDHALEADAAGGDGAGRRGDDVGRWNGAGRDETGDSEAGAVQVVDTTSVRALTQALRGDSNAEVRRTAAWALGQIEDRAATTALGDALRNDESTEVRRMAAWALGQIEDPAAAPALGEALTDEDAEVRESALWALGQIESPEAVEPLSRALRDEDPAVRKTAAWALGQIESAEAVPPLSAALDDEDAEVRAQAVWALGQIESRESVEPLTRAMSDEETEVRRQAAWALGQIESAAAVDALSRALRSDTDHDVRRQSAWALGQIEAEAAVPALVDGLSDTDPEVARMSAWALGQIEPAAAPPELIEIARTGTGELRRTALWALVRIEDPAAVPALVDALQDENSEVREQALRGLAEIGSGAAVDAIAELLQDPDPEVRAAAARALAGRGRGWGGPNPKPDPNPNPDPRPRPNGRGGGWGSDASPEPGAWH